MTLKEKFLRYVQVETTSEAECEACPSSPNQMVLANMLVDELKAMGVANARVDEHGYVYATIPAKGNHPAKVGLIAHMDTSDGVRGATKPVCIPDYDGKAITLKNGVVIDGFDFLPALAGQELIVTSGDSVLGADDKAGVAEIMTMAEYFLNHPEVPHGKIRIGFTPDEEVGQGVDHFDVEGFGADFAYTVDGGELGELEYENFNAAGAKLIVNGYSVHPGSAKNKMLNAVLLASEFQSLLPVHENPASTELYEGFYHPDSISGSCEKVVVDYIIRDHDREKFEQKKAFFKQCAEFLNGKYGRTVFEVQMRDSYYNMKEKILPENAHLIDNAVKAMEMANVTPKISPIRGGTDGARLSFMGLPCPNLCTGGANFHGRFEYAVVESMESCVEILKNIAVLYAQ